MAQQVEREMADDGEVTGRMAQTHPAGIFVTGHIEDPLDLMLNGLIANDKICVVRQVRLTYPPARRSTRRGQDPGAQPTYPSDELHRRGGGDETALAHTAGTAGDSGRATTLGSRVPGTADLDGPSGHDDNRGTSGKGGR